MLSANISAQELVLKFVNLLHPLKIKLLKIEISDDQSTVDLKVQVDGIVAISQFCSRNDGFNFGNCLTELVQSLEANGYKRESARAIQILFGNVK